MTREPLHLALSEQGEPKCSTVLKALGALRMRLAPAWGMWRLTAPHPRREARRRQHVA